MTPFTRLVVRVTACPRCGVDPGQPCRSRSGRRASFTHAARFEPAREAYWQGYEDGESDAYTAYLVNPDRFAQTVQSWAKAGGAL